ncbi:MAG: hypothetical protein DMF84_22025 [Acidobacteria bacterium]|nr:MAG: hypothetical protein DMF84_22025 [Acidobacteriota bacterium]
MEELSRFRGAMMIVRPTSTVQLRVHNWKLRRIAVGTAPRTAFATALTCVDVERRAIARTVRQDGPNWIIPVYERARVAHA